MINHFFEMEFLKLLLDKDCGYFLINLYSKATEIILNIPAIDENEYSQVFFDTRRLEIVYRSLLYTLRAEAPECVEEKHKDMAGILLHALPDTNVTETEYLLGELHKYFMQHEEIKNYIADKK